MSEPEAWLLGQTLGYSKLLMPVVHSLQQARKELLLLQHEVSTEECRVPPGTAAPIGFHLVHIGGSLDRLFTYARGEPLDAVQLDALHSEDAQGRTTPAPDLFAATIACIDRRLDDLRSIPEPSLFDAREVGRAKLPATVLGLLFHAAEHTTMHVGQVRTTLKIVRSFASLADTATPT